MSVTSEHFYSKMQTGHSGVAGIGREEPSWGRVGLGAVALGLCLLVAVAVESLWPVVVGAVLLIGVAHLMGFGALRPASSAESKRQEKRDLGLLGRVLPGMDVRRAKQRTAMASLESEIAAAEPTSVIDKLETQIGKKGKDHAKTAYVIGRQYMRLGQFDEAREWFRRAQPQSSKLSLLRESIESHLSACSIQLVAEGDTCFADGDYLGARERYARISQGLARSEEGRLALFLRSACVYCELCEYEEAGQAVLQALKSDEETDRALALLDLLQKLSSTRDGSPKAIDAGERLEDQLAGQVAGLMASLGAQRRELAGAST